MRGSIMVSGVAMFAAATFAGCGGAATRSSATTSPDHASGIPSTQPVSGTELPVTIDDQALGLGAAAVGVELSQQLTQYTQDIGTPMAVACLTGTDTSAGWRFTCTRYEPDGTSLAPIVVNVDSDGNVFMQQGAGSTNQPPQNASTTTGPATASNGTPTTVPTEMSPCPSGETRDGAENCVGPDNCPSGTEQNSVGQCMPLPGGATATTGTGTGSAGNTGNTGQ